MPPWPHHAAMAAPTAPELRGTSRWPDMLEIPDAAFSRWILTGAMLLGLTAVNAPALAQMSQGAPPPPQQGAPQAGPAQASPTQSNPMCVRLEGQLATIDRGAGSGDPAKDEQIRRYQDSAAKQQSEDPADNAADCQTVAALAALLGLVHANHAERDSDDTQDDPAPNGAE